MSHLKSDPHFAFRAGLITVVFAGLAVIMALVALKPIFLGFDSINNYAHVWYISEHLYDGSIPLHFDNLESGEALTYPYGFFSWTLAALFYPIFGDHAVTWTMLLGTALILIVVYRTRLNSSLWLLMIFALIPFFLEALLSFQMSFVWAMLFGYLYIWAVEKRSFRWAYLWLILAAANQLVIMGPILAGYTAYLCLRMPGLRRDLVRLWALALVPLGLLSWYTVGTPAVGDNDAGFVVGKAVENILRRSALFLSPFIIARLATIKITWASQRVVWTVGPLCLLALTGWYLAGASGYSGLYTEAHNDYQGYLESTAFIPGAVYRMPESPRREYGEYYFIKEGAVLSNEFFNESKFRRDWTQESYRCFLSVKKIDYVVLVEDYLRRCNKNEGQTIESLQTQGLVSSAYQDPLGRFAVYDVRAARVVTEKHSVRGCIDLEEHGIK